MAIENNSNEHMMEQEPTMNSNSSKENERPIPLSFKEVVTGSIPKNVYFEEDMEVWSSNEEDDTIMSDSQARIRKQRTLCAQMR